MKSLFYSLSDKRGLLSAAVLAIVVRLVVFIGSIFHPIPNERMLPVSPLFGQSYLDFEFYLRSMDRYQSASLSEILQDFVAFYQLPFADQFGHIISGPVFPFLIGIFEYSPDNTLPLALFFLVFNTAITVAWLMWFAKRRIAPGWLLLFAIAPNPIWFVLVLSPDSLFAGLVCVFFLVYFEDKSKYRRIVICGIALILAVLTRPNGYSLLLFVMAELCWLYLVGRRVSLLALIGMGLFLIVFSLYLYPYFITELRKSYVDIVYFGHGAGEYVEGFFHQLPTWLDRGISILLLVGAKILNLVGLRPAYGDTLFPLVLIRAAAGLVLLPGLFHLFLFAGWRERMFAGIFLLPIIFGPTQDRYNLPIFPILFLHGAMVYTYAWRRWTATKSSVQPSS